MIFIKTMDQITVCDVKGVTDNDELCSSSQLPLKIFLLITFWFYGPQLY